MRVHALVRDRVIVIDCGEGYQRVKWLAMVATQRFDDLLAITDGGYAGVAKKHVPVGLEDEAGRKIPPTKTVNRLPAAIAAADGVPVDPEYEPRVRVLLLDDAQASHKSGTSSFLTAIAAVPDMCLVAGPGLLSCVPKREATFTVYCRDNFSIPITNGGEDLSVQFTNDSGVALRAAVHDHADGTYTVSYTLPKRGAYVVDITIDGDHVIGSPFECVAVESELPAAVKWVRPNFCNGAPPTADETVVERLRALWVSQTDALLLGDILTSAWLLRTPNLRYDLVTLHGHFPPPAPQAPAARVDYACALVGGRVFLHGGVRLDIATSSGFAAEAVEAAVVTDGSSGVPVGDGAHGEPDAQVDDSLWMLDVEARSWACPQTKGSMPPPLCAHAACSHASHLFVFGGRRGRAARSGCNAELYVLDTGALVWERIAAVAAPGHALPVGRWGHTLTTVGSRLFLFGGQAQSGELLGGPHVFDLGARDWSAPVLTGAKPKARRGHAAAVWGNHLLVAMGTGAADEALDGAPPAPDDPDCSLLHEVALIEVGSLLSKVKRPPGSAENERLAASTHTSSALRTGHSVLAGRHLLLLCGQPAEPIALPLIFVPNGYMLIQSEQTEVLVPQPATKLSGNYSIEAWVCAALTQPMNIVCKTSSVGAKAEWSMQLRLDAEGRVEHALALGHGDAWLVCRSSARLHSHHWYYVVGTLTIGEMETDGLNLRLFINGVKEDEEVSNKASLHRPESLDRFSIGGESGGGYGSFCGVIGDVSVWQYALTQDTIASTWVNRHQLDVSHDTHLVGHWKMNEGHVPARIEASPHITSSAPPPVWDITRSNAQTVLDYSIYSNQGVVIGPPRCSATTVPIYFDARKH